MTDMLATMHRLTVEAADGNDRLDKYLARATGLSRMRLKGLIEAGQAMIDGATIEDVSARVKPGQVVELGVPPARPADPKPEEIALTVVHEDEHLIVIDKPAGLVVHPAPGNPDGTLVNALLAHCRGQLSGIGGVERPGIVHRIDKDTSGLLVVAKSEVAHHGLSDLFARHDLTRGYKAAVYGNPASNAGIIDRPLGRSRFDRKKMAIVEDGKDAITHWQVEARFGRPPVAALLDCRLETGRTHQIRVHLSSLGHGLIGDPVYGRAQKGAPAAALAFPRQALHAWLLGFRHPVSGDFLEFESELPEDMRQLLDNLESL